MLLGNSNSAERERERERERELNEINESSANYKEKRKLHELL